MTAEDYLRQPGFERLWAAARARWERNGGMSGTVRLTALTASEAQALDGLRDPDRRRRSARAGGTFSIALDELDRRLLAGPGSGLKTVLEHIGGPLRDRAAERADTARAAAELWERANAHPAAQQPPIAAWLDALRRNGTLTRAVPGGSAASRGQVLSAALGVLGTLPRDGVELSRLASEMLGDTHALDFGTPTGNLTVSGVAALLGRQRPRTAAGWRYVWAAAGILCDSLSCAVLTYGLAPTDTHDVAAAARAMRAAGEPHVLTLRALSRRPLTCPEGAVFVCENPAVVSYAAERSADLPVVCTGGWPNTAVATLLRQLRRTGSRLRAQGDFDWEGVRIHRHLVHAHGAATWRFDLATYSAAIDRASPGRERARLDGRPAHGTPLTQLMLTTGLAIYEEDLCDLLGADLTNAAADHVHAAA